MTQLGGLDTDVVEVVPGETATCALAIRNTTESVEEYAFHVADGVQSWTVVEPRQARVDPGTEQRINLTFRPPRVGGPAAGELRYRIYVTPVERPSGQIVLESKLRITPFTDLTAEIVPRTSTSSLWGGQHDVAVDNRGNAAVELGVAGTDPDQRLVIEAKPAVLTVGPGQAAFVKVRARPAKLRLHGRPLAHPYQVSVTPQDAPPLLLDATMVQRPLVAPGTVRVLAGLVALVLLGTALWYGLVRQAATSAAREVVREEVLPLADQARDARTEANKAAAAAEGAKQNAMRRPAATPTAIAAGIPPGATPFSERLETESGAGTTAEDSYQVPTSRILIMTYVDWQNPWAARGTLELAIDNETKFTRELAFYRNETFYFATPIEVAPGQTVRIRTRCVAAGTPPPEGPRTPRCRAYVLLGGYLQRRPAPSPSPSPG